MKLSLNTTLIAVILLLTSHLSYGQTINLGAASDFAVFTATGAFNVTGAATVVTGDVGTNVGAFTGFPPGTLIGDVHVADGVSAQAAADVMTAYASLGAVTCGQVIDVTMGGGQILSPDVYCTGAASTITGNLILDADGDPDAIFIFQIGGALATGAGSNISLINGASLCNVYWQVNGQVDLGVGSSFQGIILANGVINLLDGAELSGQALSQAGAISLSNNVVTIGGSAAVPSTITANGATTFCIGGSVTLTGNVGGIWNTGEVSSEITVSTSGDYFVTNTSDCGSVISNIISVTVNPLPDCTISGGSTTCPGEPTQLCAPDSLESYLWSTGETTRCIEVNTTGTFSITITDGNGCSSSCNHNVTLECNPVITPVDPIVLTTCNAELPVLSTSWIDCSTSGDIIGVAELESVDGCMETYLYTFSGIDACGETFGTTTTVTRTVDTTAPVITEIADFQLLECNADWPVLVTTIWSDNCSAGGEVDGVAGEVTVDGCSESRVYTFSVMDDCGNTAQSFVTVTRILDETAPVIVPIADFQLLECNADWPVLLTSTWSDNCSAGGEVDGVAGEVTVDGCSESRAYIFSVTDDCGMSTTDTTMVTRIFDETAPSIINPADFVLPGCNPEWPAEVIATWTDNCSAGGDLIGTAGDIITEDCAESREYTFSVTDDCGNEALASTTITRFIDAANPVIEPIADQLLECNADWPVLVTTWTSSCSSGGNVTGVAGEVSSSGCLQSRLYIFTVNDDCGMSTTDTTMVTRIFDETAPVIIEPADFVLPGCNPEWPAEVLATWTDNCSAGGEVDGIAGDITVDGCSESRVYTFTVTDDCDNTAQSFVTVTRILDETAPVIIEPADFVLPGCNPEWPAEVLATWTDNCSAGGDLIGIAGDIIAEDCAESREYTFTITDDCGNEALASTIITRIIDAANPVIEPIADIQLLQCNADWPVLVTPWTSNCSSGGNVTGVAGEVSSIGCVQSRLYIFTVNDDCGMSTTDTTLVTRIFDETAPVIEPIVDFQLLQCNADWPVLVTTTWSDNCSAGGEVDGVAGDVTLDGCSESRVYTFTVTDDCGNSTQSFVTVTRIFDETAPVIIEPADFVLPGCNPEWPAEIIATWTDNCSAGGDLIGIAGDIIAEDCAESREYTFTITDDCGNEAFASTIITRIIDAANPVIEPIADQLLECNADWPVLVTAWTSSCSSGGNVTGVAGDVSSIGCLQSRLYIFTVNDDCGMSTTDTTMVTRIFDETAPVIEPIADFQIAGCDQPWPSVLTTTWSDNCSAGDEVIGVAGEVTVDGCGELRVYTFSVTDDCGNTAQSFVTVTRISDETAPGIINPADFVLPGCNPEWPAEVLATWTDNCTAGGDLIGIPGDIITEDCAESREYTFSVTDDCGNEALASTIITRIIDAANPVIEPIDDFQLLVCNADWPVLVTPWTSSCSSGGNVTGVPGDVSSIGCLQSRLYIFTVNDDCGMSTSDTTMVTRIIDETAPVIVPIADFQLLECNANWPVLVTAWTSNCSSGGNVTGVTEDVSSNGCLQSRLYTFTVTDDCGNSTSDTTIVTRIIDETEPDIINPADFVLPGCNPEWPAEVLASWTDNCAAGGNLIGIPGDIITEGCTESREYTFSVTDDCGNEAFASTIITRQIEETTPEITAIADFQLELCNAPWPQFLSTTWSDNCTGGGIVEALPGEISTVNCIQTRPYTFNVTSECGNSAQAVVMVSRIFDETGPVFGPIEPFSLQCDLFDTIPTPSVTDNCSLIELSFTDQAVSEFCNRTFIRTWIATDACLNTTPAVQSITDVDTVGPVFEDIEALITVDCIEDIPVSTPTVYDECSGAIAEYQVLAIDGIGNPEETCVLSSAFGTGADWALWLPAHYSNGFSSSANFVFDANGGTFDQFANGTAHLYGTVVNDVNPAESYILDFWFKNKRDWTEWSALGRSYKNDAGFAAVSGDLWTTWSYYELVNDFSIATGTGDLAGNILYFRHTPESYVFGFQVGVAGNNKNANYGMSGWFTYTGEIDGIIINGHGDLSVDAYCTLQQTDECINRTYTINYMAFDECYNATVFSQLIIINDTIAPVFDSIPANMIASCDNVPAISDVTASDNCGVDGVEISVQETLFSGDCGVIQRIYTATDACGNTASFEHFITLVDTIAPVLVNLPLDTSYQCDETIPAPANVTATDNCEGLVSVTYTEQFFGDEPTPGAISDCNLSTVPNTNTSRSLWLQGLPEGYNYYVNKSANFVEFPDGTAHLTGTVVSATNPNAGWIIDVWFMNGVDWNSWSNQPFTTGYKNDAGFAGNNYLDWTFYITDATAATLTGIGDLAGSSFSLSHAPASQYYGFQVGVAANNFTAGYGVGGWFNYVGNFQNAEIPSYVDGVTVNGLGDFTFEGDCCHIYDVERTWTATDCSGNTTSWTQNISFIDSLENQGIVESPDTLDSNVIRNFIAISVYPNPSTDATTVEFVSTIDGTVSLDVYNYLGYIVAQLYVGDIKAGIVNKVQFDVNALHNGMYYIRMNSENESVVEKFVKQ